MSWDQCNDRHATAIKASGQAQHASCSTGDHERWMAEAISLAHGMRGHVWPNPPVGCVIVRDGEIVGRGHTQPGGRPHAERVALDEAGERAKGATLYVTLEPCCHWGKTPPCADAIIAAGVHTVHASLQDPDPRVKGGGFTKLREAGIAVEVGLAAEQAREIMAGFLHRVKTGLPLMTIGDLPQFPHAVPDGFDGRLVTDGDGVWLIVRTGVRANVSSPIDDPDAMNHLLAGLGARGLTSLYIASDDHSAGLLMQGGKQTERNRVSAPAGVDRVRKDRAARGLNSWTRKEKGMKQFDCATLVPGVEQIIRADTEANVVARAVEYLKTVLGEEGIRLSLVEEIRARVTDVPSRGG